MSVDNAIQRRGNAAEWLLNFVWLRRVLSPIFLTGPWRTHCQAVTQAPVRWLPGRFLSGSVPGKFPELHVVWLIEVGHICDTSVKPDFGKVTVKFCEQVAD